MIDKQTMVLPNGCKSCHASSIAYLDGITFLTFFGGNYEGHRRTSIWLSTKKDNEDSWSEAVILCSGKDVLGFKRACWNPVIFLYQSEIFIYFKVGKSPQNWSGHCLLSKDKGKSWSGPHPLGNGIQGPTKNPPVVLNDRILSGSSTELGAWNIHFEWSRNGRQWFASTSVDHSKIECIQPAILSRGNGKLTALARSEYGCLVSTQSADNGESWRQIKRTDLINCNSGIAALSVRPDLHVLANNDSPTKRTPLILQVSRNTIDWTKGPIIEDGNGEFSYPSLCVANNQILCSYTQNRNSLGIAQLSIDTLEQTVV